jgi:hypothetical protein
MDQILQLIEGEVEDGELTVHFDNRTKTFHCEFSWKGGNGRLAVDQKVWPKEGMDTALQRLANIVRNHRK